MTETKTRIVAVEHPQIYDVVDEPVYIKGYLPYDPAPNQLILNGRNYLLRWVTCNMPPENYVNIYYYNGNWNLIPEADHILNIDCFDWEIPPGLAGVFQFIVQDADQLNIWGISEPFYIDNNYDIRVTSPNGGETWLVDDYAWIYWQHQIPGPIWWVIDLIHDEQVWPIYSGQYYLSCFYGPIVVPNFPSDFCRVKIWLGGSPEIWDWSGDYFKIKEPPPPGSPGSWRRIYYNCFNQPGPELDPNIWGNYDLLSSGGSTTWGVVVQVGVDNTYPWASFYQNGLVNNTGAYFSNQYSVLEYLPQINTSEYKALRFKFKMVRDFPAWDEDSLTVWYHDGYTWTLLESIRGPEWNQTPWLWENREYYIDRIMDSFRFKFMFHTDVNNIGPGGWNYPYYTGAVIDEPTLYGLRYYDESGDSELQASLSEIDGIPLDYSLGQNRPNPFNQSALINFGLPEDSHVKLEVFNLLGQKVVTLVDAFCPAGYHVVGFNGLSHSAGVYFYRLEASNFVEVKKMVLLK